MMRALPVDRSATMRELDLRSLHHVYATWRGRVPPARARRVHVSQELLANPAQSLYRDGLADVLRDVANGADLGPRMSALVDHAYAPFVAPMLARHRPKHPHVDRLLADWGLHHLHLFSESHKEHPRFVRRSDHVLFAAILRDDAFLIDLVRHESRGANWSALAILEVIVRNWPDAGIVLASNWVTGLKGGNWTDEDRRRLRKAGVATGSVEINGRVWTAGLGAQSGIGVARHCMRVSWLLSGYEPTEDRVRSDLAAMAATHGVSDQWRAITHGEDFGFSSERVFVRYGCLLP